MSQDFDICVRAGAVQLGAWWLRRELNSKPDLRSFNSVLALSRPSF